MKTEKVNFKTDAHLKNIIGSELILNDNVAILELVKNSFDALSKQVIVEFKNIKRNDDSNLTHGEYTIKTSKIIIQDFGTGMDKNDIIHKWLNIAHSEKKTVRKKEGRLMAGAKGIGRFSCDRLGQYLDIFTRKQGSNYYHLKINWKEFEKAQSKIIQDIELDLFELTESEYLKQSPFNVFENGTILQISKLNKNWNVKKKNKYYLFDDLRKSLAKLINPNQAFTNDSFEIFLKVEELRNEDKTINKPIENPILKDLNFITTSIEAILDGDKIISTLKYKGDEIFVLEEKNTFNKLKGPKIHINLYFLNTYSKIYFAKTTGQRAIDFGSIYLFLNGFRVPPYGDPGDDWLGLEMRRGQGRARYLSGRDIVGNIVIDDNLGGFRIVSSREGLENTDVFEEFTKNFFMAILKRLEKFVVNGLDWEKTIEDHHEIEKKINDDFNWNKNKEQYLETEEEKQHRIFESLKSIVNVSDKNVIDFTISEALIKEIAKKQKEKIEDEYQKLLQKLEEGNLSKETIVKLFEQTSKETDEISKQTQLLKRYNLSDNTKEAFEAITDINQFKQSMLNELLDYKKKADEAEKKTIDLEKLKIDIEQRNKELEKETKRLEKEKQEIEKRRIQEEKKRKRAEEEKRKEEERRKREEKKRAYAEAQFKHEKQKNTYIQLSEKNNLSEDILTLTHSVKDASVEIEANVKKIFTLLKGTDVNTGELYELLRRIRVQNSKNELMAKMITHTDLLEERKFVDIPTYTEEYLQFNNILDNPIEIKRNDNKEFKTKINIVEYGIVLDNLLSNADKAGARKMIIEINSSDNCELLFSDDGKGVNDFFQNNSKKMFDLGVSSTKNGSGIGLYSARTLLKNMGAEILFEGNNVILKGACFKIIFK